MSLSKHCPLLSPSRCFWVRCGESGFRVLSGGPGPLLDVQQPSQPGAAFSHPPPKRSILAQPGQPLEGLGSAGEKPSQPQWRCSPQPALGRRPRAHQEKAKPADAEAGISGFGILSRREAGWSSSGCGFPASSVAGKHSFQEEGEFWWFVCRNLAALCGTIHRFVPGVWLLPHRRVTASTNVPCGFRDFF